MVSTKILHIDDDRNDLELTRLRLIRIDPDLLIDHAETAKEAIEKIENNTYDCILCDFQLKETTGLQLLQSLHEQRNTIPFIFLTGQGNEQIASEALHLGANDYFSKDAGFALYERLLNSIRRHVDANRQRIHRQMAERELRQSQTMLQLVLDSIPARVFWKDKNLQYLGCNRQMAIDAGMNSPEEIIGKSDYDLPWREQSETFRTDDRQIIESGKPKFTYEEPQNRLDGTSLILKKSKVPLTDPDGNVMGVLGVYEDITERKQVEETLKASEERYKDLLESATDGIFITDEESNYVLVNSKACEMLGYTRDELLNMKITDIVPKDDIKRQPLRLDELSSGATVINERKLLCKDGTTLPVEISARMISDGRLQAIVRDISSRQKSEALLQQSEERFHSLFESLNIGLYRTTPDGRILMANSALVQMLGYSSFEELAKVNLEETEFALNRKRSEFREKVESGGQISGFESSWLRKDGTVIHVRENARVILDSKGNVSCYEGTVEDITEQKIAEAQLQENNRLFQSVFASLKEAVFIVDPGTRTIISCNAAAERIFGYSAQELIGSNTLKLHVSKDTYEEFGKALFPALNNNGVFNTEFKMRRKDKSIFLSDHTVTEIIDDSGRRTAVVSLVRDITRQKKAEEGLIASRDTLEQKTQALEAAVQDLESFSYTVSHDLRTPLRNITSFSNLLLEDHSAELGDQGVNFLQSIVVSCKKMNNLIDNILKISQLGRVNIKRNKVDLSLLAKDIASGLLLQYADREIEFITTDEIITSCDINLMEIVLANLIGNAFKFTKSASQAKIEFAKRDLDGISTFYVRDNGIGFEASLAESLFTPFTRLHNEMEYEGSGIGLATVKKIVERHGGKVWAEGEPENGATFYFTLE